MNLTFLPIVKLDVLAVLVGIIGGFGSWVFRKVIDLIFYLFFTVPISILDSFGLNSFDWLPFIIAPIFFNF